MTAAQLVTVFGKTLQAEDALLLRRATHINLTMDSRRTVPNAFVIVALPSPRLPTLPCRPCLSLPGRKYNMFPWRSGKQG
jgi:hypothetical protein